MFRTHWKRLAFLARVQTPQGQRVPDLPDHALVRRHLLKEERDPRVVKVILEDVPDVAENAQDFLFRPGLAIEALQNRVIRRRGAP